jgi:hypothetical protein
MNKRAGSRPVVLLEKFSKPLPTEMVKNSGREVYSRGFIQAKSIRDNEGARQLLNLRHSLSLFYECNVEVGADDLNVVSKRLICGEPSDDETGAAADIHNSNGSLNTVLAKSIQERLQYLLNTFSMLEFF